MGFILFQKQFHFGPLAVTELQCQTQPMEKNGLFFIQPLILPIDSHPNCVSGLYV